MIGNLTIDKASMNLSYFLNSVRIIHNNGGRITRKDFVEQMATFIGVPAQNGGKENRTPYNKSKLPRYFGFVDIEIDTSDRSVLVLTHRGEKLAEIISENDTADASQKYYIASENRGAFIDLIFESVIFESFGKNNCGAEQSNTDVEPPKVVFKTIFELGKATAEEICYVMFGLNRGEFSSFEEAIQAVKNKRTAYNYNYDDILEEWEITNIAHDCKIINLFTNDSIKLLTSKRDEETGKTFYSLCEGLSESYRDQIFRLDVIYQPLRLFLYSTGNQDALDSWVNNSVLGGVSDNTFVFEHSDSDSDFIGHKSEDGAFIPGCFEKALLKAFQNEKKNVYLIINNTTEERFAQLFGKFKPLLRRIDNLSSNMHGWSEIGIPDNDVARYIVSNCPKAKDLFAEPEVRIPSNIQMVGTIIMSNDIEKNEFDYQFKKGVLVADSGSQRSNVDSAWYVGATGTDSDGVWHDYFEQYVEEGRWENGWDDRFIDEVRSMKPGDYIAIKATSKQKKNLPFKNNGKWVGFADIKAIGIITENPGDGKNIKVDWQKFSAPKRWYSFMGFIRDAIDLVKAEDGYAKKALLDFTFCDATQDYSMCEEHYQTDELEDELDGIPAKITTPAPEHKEIKNCLGVILAPRTNKIHPLNCIIYGAPGTGKTYTTAEYALAIIKDIAVDNKRKNFDERKAVMAEYNDYVRKGQVIFTTFHQSYGYEEFIQGLRPDTESEQMSFITVDGVFKRIADTALLDPKNNYVIIIDEINRANISKVFGELITLIEDDKRWGEVNETCATLQSGDVFAVPNNLYIVGTMNSADKSISLIDAALRRRFEFFEQRPDADLIDDPVLKSVFKKINIFLADSLESSDLLVGHSYFMNKTEADLCTILNNSIIPLLYEYYYDNKKKVIGVLTDALKDLKVEIKDPKISRVYVVAKEVNTEA